MVLENHRGRTVGVAAGCDMSSISVTRVSSSSTRNLLLQISHDAKADDESEGGSEIIAKLPPPNMREADLVLGILFNGYNNFSIVSKLIYH